MDDDRRYWFVPRGFGYGVRPIRWQGWLLLNSVLLPVLLAGLWSISHPENAYLAYTPILAALAYVAAILPTLKKRTRGTLRWRWRSSRD